MILQLIKMFESTFYKPFKFAMSDFNSVSNMEDVSRIIVNEVKRIFESDLFCRDIVISNFLFIDHGTELIEQSTRYPGCNLAFSQAVTRPFPNWISQTFSQLSP